MRLDTEKILREPLLHFVALAGILSVASHCWGGGSYSDRYRIKVTLDNADWRLQQKKLQSHRRFAG